MVFNNIKNLRVDRDIRQRDIAKFAFSFNMVDQQGLDRFCRQNPFARRPKFLNFGTRLPLFAKNSSPNCFFTLRPSRVRVPKKIKKTER